MNRANIREARAQW